ncbi:hypothetical protein BDV93DRAFT_438107, partial [Ceratobasidium sp. AG-I]
PLPADNSVLLMDNCSIYMNARVRGLVEAQGVVCMYLPLYSPDFNPIDLAFSKSKSSIQHEGAAAREVFHSRNKVLNAQIEAMLFCHGYSVTEEDARGWYRHYCYVD